MNGKPWDSRERLVVGVILAVLALGFLFQVFFRYEYVRSGGATVYRIDRLTGGSCSVGETC